MTGTKHGARHGATPARTARGAVLKTAILLLGMAGSGALFPAGTTDAATPESCTALTGTTDGRLTVQSAEQVPATPDAVAYCRIHGKIADRIGFEARLPAADWNGELFMAGCGGFCGAVQPDKTGFSNSILPAGVPICRRIIAVNNQTKSSGTSVELVLKGGHS